MDNFTPDELMTEVVALGSGYDFIELIDVIGAVITLHSPEGNNEQQCAHDKRAWPCETIQTIGSWLQ